MQEEIFEKYPIPKAYFKLALPVVFSMVISLIYNDQPISSGIHYSGYHTLNRRAVPCRYSAVMGAQATPVG